MRALLVALSASRVAEEEGGPSVAAAHAVLAMSCGVLQSLTTRGACFSNSSNIVANDNTVLATITLLMMALLGCFSSASPCTMFATARVSPNAARPLLVITLSKLLIRLGYPLSFLTELKSLPQNLPSLLKIVE